jgi:hypothetical protein
MNITNIARADQLIPISKARALLPSLVNDVAKSDFFVLVKKYKPKAALVHLDFLNKLLDVYYRWKRQQDFSTLNKIRESIPTYKSDEVEKNIKNAIADIRKTP